MDAVTEPIRMPTHKAKRTRAARPANGRLNHQAKKVSQDLRDMGRLTEDVAQEHLDHLRASATALRQQGRDTMQHMERTLEQFILERPLKTVLIAAGIGLLFGRFWMRR